MPMDLMGTLGGYSGQIYQMAFYAGVLVVALVIAAAVLYFMVFRRKYDVPVTIFAVRQEGSTVISKDFGHISRDKGKECMILKNNRAILPPPPFEYGVVDKKGRTHFHIIQVGISEFRYAKPNIEDYKNIILSPDQRDIIAWSVYAKNQFEKMFSLKNWLEQYAPYLILALAIGGVVIVLAVTADTISEAIVLGKQILSQSAATATAPTGASGITPL